MLRSISILCILMATGHAQEVNITQVLADWTLLDIISIRPTWRAYFPRIAAWRLGPRTHVVRYEGGGTPVHKNPHALDCSFDHTTKCCWMNVGGRLDEFDWMTIDSPSDPSVWSKHFGSGIAPQRPFLATGSQRTQPHYQALLASCPIVCQHNEGMLTLSHFLTKGVTLDICRIEVGRRVFIDACEKIEGSRTSMVQIKGHDKPFHIAILASGFTDWPIGVPPIGTGGFAVIDDIIYAGAALCSDPKPAFADVLRWAKRK